MIRKRSIRDRERLDYEAREAAKDKAANQSVGGGNAGIAERDKTITASSTTHACENLHMAARLRSRAPPSYP